MIKLAGSNQKHLIYSTFTELSPFPRAGNRPKTGFSPLAPSHSQTPSSIHQLMDDYLLFLTGASWHQPQLRVGEHRAFPNRSCPLPPRPSERQTSLFLPLQNRAPGLLLLPASAAKLHSCPSLPLPKVMDTSLQFLARKCRCPHHLLGGW